MMDDRGWMMEDWIGLSMKIKDNDIPYTTEQKTGAMSEQRGETTRVSSPIPIPVRAVTPLRTYNIQHPPSVLYLRQLRAD